MTASLSGTGNQPLFAHHVRRLLARQAKEDREAIGATLNRRGFKRQDIENAAAKYRKPAARMSGILVDFSRASPLTGRPRQSGSARVPHFDISRITPTHVPTSRDGKERPDGKSGSSGAASHVDYVIRGAVVTMTSHLDYIRRDAAVEDLEAGLVIDMLDEAALRDEQNKLALFSNIPGGLARQRSLFEAADRCERKPRHHQLMASTAVLGALNAVHLYAGGSPGPMGDMVRLLSEGRQRVEKKAQKTGRPIKHIPVPIASLTSDEIYDWLQFLDQWKDLVSWKQGRTGRSQTRFVGELPANLTPAERHAIVQSFCDQLNEFGYMYVAAIHQPDWQSGRANYHFHVDVYDRPAKWLEQHECWDFEYSEMKRGKPAFPYRQNKVRHSPAVGAGDKTRVNDAALLRRIYIDVVNEVVGHRADVAEYLHGTYADNGIRLTPLEHMGNRAIAAEKQGIETKAGTVNAHRIVQDELRACEDRAAVANRELDGEVALMRAISADRAALAEYEVLRRQIIERQLQVDFCDVIVNMVRSRGDTVIRASATSPSSSPAGGHDALLLAARAHVRSVERQAPSPAERAAVSKKTKALDRKAEGLRVQIMDACVERPASISLQYRPRDRVAVPNTAPHPGFETQMCGRLLAWIDKHGADADRLTVKDDTVALGASVPKSIDTLMLRFIANQSVQQALRRAEARLKKAEAAAAGHRVSSIVDGPAVTTLPISRDVGEGKRGETVERKPTAILRDEIGRRATVVPAATVKAAAPASVDYEQRHIEAIFNTGDDHEYDRDTIADLIAAASLGRQGLRQPGGEEAPRRQGFVPIRGVRAVPRIHVDEQGRSARDLLRPDGRPGDRERQDTADRLLRGSGGGVGQVENGESATRDAVMPQRSQHDAIGGDNDLPAGWQAYREGRDGR